MKSLSDETLDPQALAEKQKDPRWGAELLRQISIFGYFHEDELAELYALGNTVTQAAK